MEKDEINIILNIFKAIDDDWAICDDRDEDEHMVIINEDRETKADLKPSKKLIAKLEEQGLIELDKLNSDIKGSNREYMDFGDEDIPVPFVYMYKLTSKGKAFRAESTKP